jgi:transcriptional regulator with XRE-family HTH domain
MVTDIDIIIGKRLRLRRIQLGLSQHDVASVVGVRFQQIQKYECGSNRIAASRLWLMSQALDTSVSFFFEGLTPLPKAVSAHETRERRPA